MDRTNYWLRRRISRRATLAGGAAGITGAAAFALVGCGDDDDDDGGQDLTPGGGLLPTAAASPTVGGQAVPGGAFNFQMPAVPPSLDPYTQTSFQNAYVNGLSYSKLLRFRAGTPEVAPADNSMEPDLASAMPEQPDEVTYVFTLKPNLRFHNVPPTNGRPLTSEDIVYALDRYKNFEKSVHRSGLAFIERMETPDPNTVTITTAAPYADTIFYLGGNLGVWISPREHAESDQAATRMVGSGPFIHTGTQTGVSLSFEKFPEYFDQPYPYFDTVTAYGTSDLAKRISDFTAKSVDLSWLFLPDPREQVKSNRPDAQSEVTQGIGGYIYLRTDQPPFNDKRVRQAMSMGINREAVREAITSGEGVNDQLYFVGYPWARQVEELPQARYWEYNVAEAKQMLEAAGVENIDTTWSHADVTAYGQEYLDTATLVQNQLQELNINITDNTQPYAQYISTTYQGNYEGMGHSPRAIAYWLDYVTERFTMKPRRGRINLSYVNDPALETLLDKQRGQFDMDERLQTVRQIEEHVAEEQYEIYFSTDTRTYFWDPKIRNYRPTAWFPYTHIMKTWREP